MSVSCSHSHSCTVSSNLRHLLGDVEKAAGKVTGNNGMVQRGEERKVSRLTQFTVFVDSHDIQYSSVNSTRRSHRESRNI